MKGLVEKLKRLTLDSRTSNVAETFPVAYIVESKYFHI